VVGEVAEAVGEPAGLFGDAVDGFCAAVGHPAGGEVGEDLCVPAAQRAAESLDLGNGAGVEGVEYLLCDLAPRGGVGGVIDRADLLIDQPGDFDRAVGVADRQVGREPLALPVGEVLASGEQGAADLVERVVLVTTSVQGVLLDPPADLVQCVPASLTTWNASRTAVASGSSSRIALA